MTHEAFDKLLESRLSAIKAVLGTKAKEYATGEDRLHNFKSSADILRCSPEEACLSFMVKHLTSIIDMVKSETTPAAAVVDEKIGDAINYLILLEALFKE